MTPRSLPFSILLVFTACGRPSGPAATASDSNASRPDTKSNDGKTGSNAALPDVASVRTDLHCTQKSNGEEAACKAKDDGCRLGPPLECYGTPPPEEYREESRKRYAASADTCTCVCPIDQKRCSEVP